MIGYRRENGTVEFTTFYDWLYEQADIKTSHEPRESVSSQLSLQDFEIALPLDRVQSLNLFDVEIYAEFQDRIGSQAPERSPITAPLRDESAGSG